MDQLASAVLNHLLPLLSNPSISAYMNMMMAAISPKYNLTFVKREDVDN